MTSGVAASAVMFALAGALALGCSDRASGSRGGTGGGLVGTGGSGASGSTGAGAEAGGQGGGPPPLASLPPCQAWPEAQGPAFSLPIGAPSTIEIARRSANGQTLYGLGLWTNGGVAQRALLRSMDDGGTWCPLATPAALTSIVPAPGDNLTLWAIADAPAGGAGARDVLRSVDGGASFQSARGDLPMGLDPGAVVMVGPTGRDVAWIATSDAPNGAAFTRDGGRTWSRVALFQIPAPPAFTFGTLFAIDPAQPGRILVVWMTFDPDTGAMVQRLRRSIDWGATWSEGPSPIGDLNVTALAVDPASTLYAVSGSDAGVIWRSRDWGTSWAAGGALPTGAGGQPLLAGDPGAADHLFIQSGEGQHLFETLDGGDTWRDLPLPYGFSKGFGVVSAGPAAGQVLVSTPIGLQATADGGSTWTVRTVLPAAATAIAVSPANPDVTWAVTSGESLRSSDGGKTWNVVRKSQRFIAVAPDPSDGRSAFAIEPSGAAILRTSDGGYTWQPLALTHSPPRHVVVAPDGRVLYAVTDAGIESSQDSGATWGQAVGVDAPPGVGLALAVSPTDGRHAVVLSARRSAGDSAIVFETRDAGATVASAMVVPGLASQLQFTSIALLEDDVILVGGQSGVLRSTDGGASWIASNQGIEPGAPRALAGAPVWSIVAPPSSPREVWALADHAFRSMNGGIAWTSWPTPIPSLPNPLDGALYLVSISGDPRPGGHLLGLASPQSPVGFFGEPVTNGMLLLELRP